MAGDLVDVFVVGDSVTHPGTIGLITDAIPLGAGYRLYASDGGVFDFGDAGYSGSLGGIRLNSPVVGAAPTRTGTATGWTPSDGECSPSGTLPLRVGADLT